MARKKRITHRSLRMALDDEGGNITNVATALMVSRKTVYEALERFPDLKASLEGIRMEARRNMFEVATNNLMLALLNNEKWATLFALNKYDDLAEGEAPGGLGLSAEVLAMLEDMGTQESEVVRAFEEMVRTQARKATVKAMVEGD